MILGPYILQRRRNYNDMSITLFKTCSVTGEEYNITLSDQQFRTLLSPDCPAIQEFLPNLSVGEREFIMTGITPEEFEVSFPDE
ncbi:MAG: hypothetical protein ACWGQW_01525 [bacterium]